MTTTLDSLPNEILFIIASHFGCDGRRDCHVTQKSFASLARTNRRLHNVFNPILWRFNRECGISEGCPYTTAVSAVSWAASRNRIDILEIAVKYQHDLGSFHQGDPIHRAAKNGHDATVSWLLDHGVPIECVPCERIAVDSPFPVFPWPQNHVSPSYSVLHTALVSSQGSTSILLLSRGAKYQFKSETNKSAIHLAALHGLSAVIEYLVKTMGIDVNQEDQHGMTPLHYAVERRDNVETIQVLLDLGADKDTEQYPQSPLVRALKMGHFSNAMLLLDAGADVNPTFDYQEAPLVVCAQESFALIGTAESSVQYKVLRKIIANGAALDVSYNKNTALCSAVEQGTVAAVYELLRAGADVEMPRDKDGQTPFDLLWTLRRYEAESDCSSDYNLLGELIEKARLLIAAGARLDTQSSEYGSTQLEKAIHYCFCGSTFLLRELLRLATHRNVRDGYINELFETCLTGRQLEPAMILAHHGATSDNANKLAFIWAEKIGKTLCSYSGMNVEALSFCLDFLSAEQIEELFTHALNHANEERCQKFIDRGALSSWRKSKVFKPWLHIAASRGFSALVRRLVGAGMDINALDEEGRTPMLAALEVDDTVLDTVGQLFELGADPFHPRPDAECRRLPNPRSKEILSPFELAIRRNCLPEIRRWWLNSPPESRPTGEIYIPCVQSTGPWHQNYLKYLRGQTDSSTSEIVGESQQWDIYWMQGCDMRKLDEEEEKKTKLMDVMNERDIPEDPAEDYYLNHFWESSL
ncbi:ankyrin [Annulohypoxylon truncatum]|uniref:ankyrin n=1 Tax=Annulohypoxylon truncatum TaxID=327061 RepID=UPI00200759AB|nr:ankyrin [Annulohypoxylon truncatum]KAI1211033.1 ankyrin [Annulohypoxylon truncatum]